LSKFSVVKRHIDEMDYYGLLASDAPADEYDSESKLISNSITESSTIQEIASKIAGVFSRQFNDNLKPYWVIGCAEKIYRDLHENFSLEDRPTNYLREMNL